MTNSKEFNIEIFSIHSSIELNMWILKYQVKEEEEEKRNTNNNKNQNVERYRVLNWCCDSVCMCILCFSVDLWVYGVHIVLKKKIIRNESIGMRLQNEVTKKYWILWDLFFFFCVRLLRLLFTSIRHHYFFRTVWWFLFFKNGTCAVCVTFVWVDIV